MDFRSIFDGFSKLPPFVQVVLILALAGLAMLIVFQPAAGGAILAFAMGLQAIFKGGNSTPPSNTSGENDTH